MLTDCFNSDVSTVQYITINRSSQTIFCLTFCIESTTLFYCRKLIVLQVVEEWYNFHLFNTYKLANLKYVDLRCDYFKRRL